MMAYGYEVRGCRALACMVDWIALRGGLQGGSVFEDVAEWFLKLVRHS